MQGFFVTRKQVRSASIAKNTENFKKKSSNKKHRDADWEEVGTDKYNSRINSRVISNS
jgi:hypothetical protein